MDTDEERDAERQRRDYESVRKQHWSVDLICALGLIAVIGLSLAECSGTFDEPAAKCDCITK